MACRLCPLLWGQGRQASQSWCALGRVRCCSHRLPSQAGPRSPSEASPGPAGPHPCPGHPLPAPRLTSTPSSPRRGDWLLRFVYRTSSVQLHVAGLQPVLLQDRRVENVDLSSIVSTPHRPVPPRAFPGGRAPAFLQPPSLDTHPAQGREVTPIYGVILMPALSPGPLHVLSNPQAASRAGVITPVSQTGKLRLRKVPITTTIRACV